MTVIASNLQLAWSSSADEDRQFLRITYRMLVLLMLLGLVVPWVHLPELNREELETLPPQLARVLLEKKILPSVTKPKSKPKPKIKKKIVKATKPKPKPTKPKVAPKPAVQKVEDARKKAATSGLLQFQDDLMAMRESLDVSTLSPKHLTRGQAKAAKIDRSVITSQSKRTNGGINTAALSRDVGGVALSGKETTRVRSQLAQGLGVHAQAERRRTSARSDEDIRKVMDRNKGAIFSIYNRALRQDPALEGKVSVKMVIEANGRVSSINIVSSELNNPLLERKLLARIRLINFGAADVLATTLNYSFDFLPY